MMEKIAEIRYSEVFKKQVVGEYGACRIGLGISFEERNSVVGIDDSGAGVCSIQLAGFPTIGFDGGNILESGTR